MYIVTKKYSLGSGTYLYATGWNKRTFQFKELLSKDEVDADINKSEACLFYAPLLAVYDLLYPSNDVNFNKIEFMGWNDNYNSTLGSWSNPDGAGGMGEPRYFISSGLSWFNAMFVVTATNDDGDENTYGNKLFRYGYHILEAAELPEKRAKSASTWTEDGKTMRNFTATLKADGIFEDDLVQPYMYRIWRDDVLIESGTLPAASEAGGNPWASYWQQSADGHSLEFKDVIAHEDADFNVNYTVRFYVHGVDDAPAGVDAPTKVTTSDIYMIREKTINVQFETENLPEIATAEDLAITLRHQSTFDHETVSNQYKNTVTLADPSVLDGQLTGATYELLRNGQTVATGAVPENLEFVDEYDEYTGDGNRAEYVNYQLKITTANHVEHASAPVEQYLYKLDYEQMSFDRAWDQRMYLKEEVDSDNGDNRVRDLGFGWKFESYTAANAYRYVKVFLLSWDNNNKTENRNVSTVEPCTFNNGGTSNVLTGWKNTFWLNKIFVIKTSNAERDENTYGNTLFRLGFPLVTIDQRDLEQSGSTWDENGVAKRAYTVTLDVQSEFDDELNAPYMYRIWRDGELINEGDLPTGATVSGYDWSAYMHQSEDYHSLEFKDVFVDKVLQEGETMSKTYKVRFYSHGAGNGGSQEGAPRRAPGATWINALAEDLYMISEQTSTVRFTNDIPTAVDDLAAASEVAGVKYVNLAGQVSDRPFDGVNIVVTRMANGSQQVTKMVK